MNSSRVFSLFSSPDQRTDDDEDSDSSQTERLVKNVICLLLIYFLV